MLNLPNLFLFYRILAVPAVLVCYAFGWPLATLIIFLTAAVSDFFDGYFARKLNLVNDFGKLMDPLADKIITAAAFICLTSTGVIPVWMVVVIISREFLVTGMRSLEASHGKIVAARWSGKAKTMLQMISITLLLADVWLMPILGFSLGMWVFYLAVLMTVYSGVEYCYDSRDIFKATSSKKK